MHRDRFFLAVSILIQLTVAYFFGHAYDTRIFMASGYLVGTGQNPYIVQNVSSVFHNNTFQGITTFGYPPPWALVLGLIYLCSFKIIPNFLLYNLAIKLPIIAANIGLAYLVAHVLDKSGVRKNTSRRAWLFILFNPFLLCVSAAWGQFDAIVALLSLLSLFFLSEDKLVSPAILLALVISFKPIALPLILVEFVFLSRKSFKRTLQYFGIFCGGLLLFSVIPFVIFRWDPTPIFQHWNAHFTVGGGISFMTFLEPLKNTYQLVGPWLILGWIWVPPLVVSAYLQRSESNGIIEMLKNSVALILIFFLCRTWVSEPNITLVLPFVLILICMKELNPLSLAAVWVLPLIFGIFNTSIAQLFFPSMPGIMDSMLKLAVEYNPARFIIRTVVVITWFAAGWWIVYNCLKKRIDRNRDFVPE